VRHVHIYRGGRSPDRIPLDGAAGAEPGARRPEPIPDLDAIVRPGPVGPGAGAGPQAEATALIRQANESGRPGS
jgi:hypothetical protein